MPTAYDELPYPGAPFAQTHPDHLATLAFFFGMTSAPVDGCRVLELGCGDGGNLIPMAFNLPKSHFTGIDLAATAIGRGQELVDDLHLKNIRLQHFDLMAVDSTFGEFDYILAHGLYSWVPPQVREKILGICKSHLAANGIAFISYNAYPGGHLRDAIRKMMQFHTRHASSALERMQQGRQLLEFLLEALPQDEAYSVFLRAELQSILERRPEGFYHDEQGEYNNRFYFREFAEQASRYGLQHLCDAHLLSMQLAIYPQEVVAKIRTFSPDDDLALEQYMDFLKLRKFRQSLLCRSEVRLNRSPDPKCVNRLSVASAAEGSAGLDLRSTAAGEFKFSSGASMSTNHPLAKAAMLHLGRVWPQAVPYSEVLRVARTLAERDAPGGEPEEEDASWLSDMILKLFVANFVELHIHAPVFAAQVSERPVASPLARLQVRNASSVTNQRHTAIEVGDDAARQLLLILDGTRDRQQLLAELRGRLNSGEVTAERLETNLNRLAKKALLVA